MNELPLDRSLDGRTTLLDRVLDPQLMGRAEDLGHFLVVLEGADTGRVIELGEASLAIGRSAPCEVVLPDQEVSRRHCSVQLVGGAVMVTDHGSTNGTFIDGLAVSAAAELPVGAVLQVGRELLKHERRSRREVHAKAELDRDLDRASRYVESLLPPRLKDGPILADWIYLPSARLGGDVFGYHAFDERYFAVYLVDVSGHGAESAMHAVGIMNVLRSRALPGVDFRDPAAVISRLNSMFPMEEHASMFFTIWYGVFDRERRLIDYCSAGHHPSYLRPLEHEPLVPLRTPNLAVGVMQDASFVAASAEVPAGAVLYVFSDGVFEIVVEGGRRWELEDFVQVIAEPPLPEVGEPQRLYSRVRREALRSTFDDDFSLLTLTFA